MADRGADARLSPPPAGAQPSPASRRPTLCSSSSANVTEQLLAAQAAVPGATAGLSSQLLGSQSASATQPLCAAQPAEPALDVQQLLHELHRHRAFVARLEQHLGARVDLEHFDVTSLRPNLLKSLTLAEAAQAQSGPLFLYANDISQSQIAIPASPRHAPPAREGAAGPEPPAEELLAELRRRHKRAALALRRQLAAARERCEALEAEGARLRRENAALRERARGLESRCSGLQSRVRRAAALAGRPK